MTHNNQHMHQLVQKYTHDQGTINYLQYSPIGRSRDGVQ